MPRSAQQPGGLAVRWSGYCAAGTVIIADELAGRPRLALRVEESPDFTEQGDC
jgi:hypothetical protein